jgi:hypothetical protein
MRFILILLFLPWLFHCQREVAPVHYSKSVGDIDFDPRLDNPEFKICNSYVYQYFNLGYGVEYEGEKLAIEKVFQEKYQPGKAKKQSGTIRIRFLVNCKGEMDRFRAIGMDENWNEKTFHPSITDQLIAIAKSLKGWKPKVDQGNRIDFYQYLIFTIEKGEIIEILP